MKATMFTGFGTPYQRLIHQEMRNPLSSWVNGPSDSTLLRMDSSFNTPFRITFYGDGLFFNGSTFGGTVDRVEVVRVNFMPGQPLTTTKLADITDLPSFNMADLAATAALIELGEPDFTSSDTVDFYDILTSNAIIGSDKKDFIETAFEQTNIDIQAGAGNDVALISGGSGSVKMGAGKKDAVDFRNATESVSLDIGTGEVKFGADLITIAGGDVFFGTELNDTLTGSSDEDFIYGRGGDDRIAGLGANDRLLGDAGDDVILGGRGDDSLFGQTGDDTLKGQGDSDFVNGGQGEDRLLGGSGEDSLHGDQGNDKLFGNGGQDFIFGGTGKDFLFGNKGGDTLFGGKGNDEMTGGKGRDQFAIGLVGPSGTDTVTDFTIGQDKIKLNSQTQGDVTITKLSGDRQYHVDHALGDIFVTLTAAGMALTIDDILF